MTIALSYEGTLSRVQIALSGLPDGTVRVERSTNELLWETVRGGVALPVVSGAAALDDFEFVTDVENFYRVVPVGPAPGLLLDGTSGNYASTPDDPGLEITGDVVLRAEVTYDDYGLVQQAFVAKFDSTADQRSYLLFLTSGGNLRLQWSEDGIASDSETSGDPLSDVAVNGQRIAISGWLDVDLSGGGTDHRVTFYTAPTMDGPWTQFGGAQDGAGVVGPLHDGTAALTVGAFNAGTSSVADGFIHRAQVWAGNLSGGELNTGTMLADVDFGAQPAGTTSFDDAQGNPWTVNGTASITGTEQDSITPSLAGQVWLKSIRWPFLNQVVRVADYSDIERPGRIGVFPVTGRSTPIAVTDVRGSRAWSIDLITETNDEDRTLELSIMAGGTWFLHVPTTTGNALLPGSMYAVAGQTRKHRIGGVSALNRWTLELVEVAPPAPDVVGTTMTWGTVFNLYGSWGALLAANPTWGDLLSTVGSPEDLVVL